MRSGKMTISNSQVEGNEASASYGGVICSSGVGLAQNQR